MSAVLKPNSARDALMPSEPRGLGLGLVLALLAHALLIAGLAIGVNWRASEPQGVEAELWSAVPQAAAPRAVEPEPTPPTPTPTPAPTPVPPPPKPEQKVEVKPPPVVKPEPVLPDPQIAIEQAKRDDAKRKQALDEQRERDKKKKETAQREAAERDQQRAELERKKREADAKEKDKDKAEATKLAAAREANLKRMLGQAGATGGPTATGTAAQSSGPSAGYAGRIMAQIKRNIVFNDSIPGNPVASVELRLAPDGTIVSRRLLKSSGSGAWDDAVLRAIDKTAVLPRDIDGRVPSVMEIYSKPYE